MIGQVSGLEEADPAAAGARGKPITNDKSLTLELLRAAAPRGWIYKNPNSRHPFPLTGGLKKASLRFGIRGLSFICRPT